MADSTISNINVRILDKEYQVACPQGQEQDLLEAARALNAKMLEIKNSGKIIGSERIAVMAALNLSNELNCERKQYQRDTEATKQRLQGLTDKVERVLAEQS